MLPSDRWDIAVIGAGAAGLMAAIAAAEEGQRTLLLEKNKKPGVKILMSGGTRCNLTHATDNRGVVEAFGPPGRFLYSALAALSVEQTIDFFEAEGVATKVEETGKVFPVSNKATDVLKALLRRLHRSGAALALGEPLLNLKHEAASFILSTPLRTVIAQRLILTTGGQSYPGSGTTGDGYPMVSSFGHTIVPPRPALVPIKVDAPWVPELRGITLPDVRVRILQGQKEMVQRRGSLLFAHFGLSGPVILDVSRVVSGHPQPETLTLEMKLLPDTQEPDLDELLRGKLMESGKKQLAAVLATLLPRRLCDALLSLCQLPQDRKSASVNRADRGRLVQTMKHLQLPITGTLGFGKAEVTAGGVSLDEVDSGSMRSKLARNLFIAGEVLDLDGPIGGYNFQSAFSTGWLAGKGAARLSS
jgi:predicted Rossmann fold flavoprotein